MNDVVETSAEETTESMEESTEETTEGMEDSQSEAIEHNWGSWSYMIDPYQLYHFDYITELPITVTEQDFYELQARSYNLFLTFVWLVLLLWLIDKLFHVFKVFYRK